MFGDVSPRLEPAGWESEGGGQSRLQWHHQQSEGDSQGRVGEVQRRGLRNDKSAQPAGPACSPSSLTSELLLCCIIQFPRCASRNL